MEQTKAISKIDSRTIFAPYFRARWQNMQNIINDSAFISLLPANYQTYYQTYIRQWLQWASGYVPMLHRSDFFSTGIGYTVCDIFTRECMSGGFRFSSKNQSLKTLIESWGDDELNNIFNSMFFFANSGGNAVLCLTPVNGELAPSVIPINRIIFTIGRRGKITQATILNRFMSGGKSYYAKETRILCDNKPYYKVLLVADNGLATNPSWGNTGVKNVPIEIKEAWETAYGNIEPNKWYLMPIKSLGLYNVRNKSVAVALTDMPGYSDSTLHTALDVLYSIDYNYTQAQMDQYWGKTRVLVPKEMKKVAVNTANSVLVGQGVSFVEAIQSPQLEDEIYSQVTGGDSIDGKPIQPIFIQPDLRGEAHKYIRDTDLELLASKVGLSSTTLANHLSYNTSKTATEVHSEQDTTETTVNNKRALANKAINAMIKEVAEFYGYYDEISINWNRSSVNSTAENEALLRDYQAGTLPLREYLKRRHRDLTEEEIETWATALEEQKIKPSLFGEL